MVNQFGLGDLGFIGNKEARTAPLILIDVGVKALIVFAVEFITLLIAYRIIRCGARRNCHCRNKKK